MAISNPFESLQKELHDIKSILDEMRKNSVSPTESSEPIVYLSPSEVSGILGVSRQTLFNWREKDILPASKIGNRIRYSKANIDNYMNKGGLSHE